MNLRGSKRGKSDDVKEYHWMEGKGRSKMKWTDVKTAGVCIDNIENYVYWRFRNLGFLGDSRFGVDVSA